MEKNLSRFRNLDLQSPNLNSQGALLSSEQQNSIPAYMKPFPDKVFSTHGSLHSYPSIRLPQSGASLLYETPNWPYCVPRFHEAFAPPLNPMPSMRPLSGGTIENVQGGNAGFGAGCGQKRFLVFDQSGDQTTLIYSSGIGSPAPYLSPCNPKPTVPHNWFKEKLGIDEDKVSPLGPLLTEEYDQGNPKEVVESEMHEDTEELNALLYSDDDNDYSEDDDDEETSTGHSPSTMTAHQMQDWFEENGEVVASSAGSTKRQKLSHGGYDMPSGMDAALLDTANSVKRSARSELDDDAASSCGNQVPGEFGSFSCRKRSRKEYMVHDTLRTLQSMIPDGKGKNAIDVIEEAIHYLRSLKAKVKDLGLDSL